MASAQEAERNTAKVTIRTDLLTRNLVAELVDAGSTRAGFEWWAPSKVWRTNALIADYLIQSVMGTGSAITAASYSAVRHEEATFRQSNHVKLLRQRGLSREAFTQQLYTPAFRTLQLEAETAIEATYFHCGQTLDRLAAVVAIVGAFDTAVQGVDWGVLDKIRSNPTGKNARVLAPDASELRGLQQRLLNALIPASGPTGWLAWMRDARNGATHRAQPLRVHYVPPNGGLVALLSRNPKWSDLQTLAYSGRDLRDGVPGAFLASDPVNVINGLVSSVQDLTLDLLTVAAEVWEQRKEAGLAQQPERQWPKLDAPEETEFTGYGDKVKWRDSDSLWAHPATGRRYRSARVLDDRVADWHQPL